MTKIERMSDEDQKRKNTSFSMNATQFINTIRKNETQKNFSKMIQNFENLFHQEFMKIEKVSKIFAV